MVKVTALASSAFLSFAASEVVLALSQQPLNNPFQSTCVHIAASISSASAVFYSRQSHVHSPFSGSPIFPVLLSFSAVHL